MADIAALKKDYEAKRKLRDEAKKTYEDVKLRNGGLVRSGQKVIRKHPKRTDDFEALKIEGDRHAAYMRAGRAASQAATKLEIAKLRSARAKGTSKESSPYTPHSEHRFMRDLVVAGEMGQSGPAQERLNRHQKIMQETRQTGWESAGGAVGFANPSWWDEFAPFPRPAAVIRSAIPAVPLPPKGDLGYMPAWTGGSEAAIVAVTGGHNDTVQTADGSVSSAYITAELCSLGANWDVDRAVFERCSPIAEISFGRDLMAAYDAALDLNLYSGDGTAGDNVGLLNAGGGTYDGTAASDAPAQVQALAAAAASMFGDRHALPTHVVLHPARFLYLQAGVTTAGAPLLGAGGVPAAGIGADATWSAGTILGMRCLVSDQVDEANAILWRPSDSLGGFSEGLYTYPDVGSGMNAIRLQAYGLSQTFLHRVPSSVMVVENLPSTGF